MAVFMPMYFYELGFAVFSTACFKEGWLPQMRHLGHLGGIVFGAFRWAVGLRTLLAERAIPRWI